MTISHITKYFGVVDAKVFPMTADPAGGSATYGSAIDVPGINQVGVDGNIESFILFGDNVQLDADQVLSEVTASFVHAKENLDLLPKILGGTVTDAGTGSTETATWDLLGTDTLFPPFGFRAKLAKSDLIGGDVHIVLYKCTLASFPGFGFEQKGYRAFERGLNVFPRLADSKWISVPIQETGTAITAMP